MFRTIRWRIAVPYVVLILLIMLGLSTYLSNMVRQAHLADLESKLTDEAQLVGDALGSQLARGTPNEVLDSLVLHYADLLGARVTIIAADGTVLGESHEERTGMDNHLYRPEVQEALAKGQGSSIRFSRTVQYDMMYVAVPVRSGEQVVGLARLALPLQQVEASVARLRWGVLGATLVAAGMAVLLALFIAERTARPVRELTQVAERMAEGDLGIRLFPTTRDEIGQLTRAFNHMADQLQEKISTLADERSRLAAIMDNMADGVLITDGEGRVRLINPAAARLLSTTQAGAVGLSFAQVARHHQLIELWQRSCSEGKEQFEAIELGPGEPFLRAIVTPSEAKDPASCLVILQDLSEIRRLETVRRDFLGNISHELRTPLASLRALVETLRDGALEDPLVAQRFLDHMETEVDALSQIIQESLELSRVESGEAPMLLTPASVADVVLPPVERLQPQADRAELSIRIALPSDLPQVLADEERAQQVVTNLVHNAIKFTPSGGEVTISAEPVGDEVVISVRDTGVGIPAEDVPRIFERFYKADRARSGGGTGLGLAIARHIVESHGGRIWAESIEGQGSRFCFSLRTVK